MTSATSIEQRRERAQRIIHVLQGATKNFRPPMTVTISQEFGKNPFMILVSCLLSLRTKDTTTLPVSRQLFAVAQTPQQILNIPLHELEKLIHPVGFYRKKAQQLHEVSQQLLQEFDGQVPRTKHELRSIKGVGLKTANLVLSEAFDIPAICVDTHVHRISNRLGLVNTKTPEQTEAELQQVIPKKLWSTYHRLLVMWGQNICVPISPWCSRCAIAAECERRGVTSSR